MRNNNQMHCQANGRRRKGEEAAQRPKQRQATEFQEVFPVEVPNLQGLSPQIRQYIGQLEREYIQRYNILHANRRKYQDIIENLSVELDEKGISHDKLAEIYRNGPNRSQ